MTEQNKKNTTNQRKVPPLPPLPSISRQAQESADPDLYEKWKVVYNAWQETVRDCFKQNRKMFETTLKGFMKPFWLSIGMNVAVFVVGIVSFSVAMMMSLFTGQYLLGLIFGGIDATSFLVFFLSNPIENLEKDMGFVAWLGVTYNTYWTRSTFAMTPNTFQKDMQDITDDAVKSLQQLLVTHKEISRQRFLRRNITSSIPTTRKDQETKS